MHDRVIIPDRGEFVDALERLRRGHVLVKTSDGSCGCVLDGSIVHTAHRPLIDYGVVDAFENPAGFEAVHYYRLSPRAREFADRVCRDWKRRSLLSRLAVRLVG